MTLRSRGYAEKKAKAARALERAAFRSAQDEAAGRTPPAPVPTLAAPVPVTALLAPDTSAEIVRVVARLGAVAKPAYRGKDAPLSVEFSPASILWKDQPLRSPQWLKLVRALPCSFCEKRGPNEANHYPGKGRSGGGSDFETHPACGGPAGCHAKITDHKISDAAQAGAVANTLRTLFGLFRTGVLPKSLFLKCLLEATVNP